MEEKEEMKDKKVAKNEAIKGAKEKGEEKMKKTTSAGLKEKISAKKKENTTTKNVEEKSAENEANIEKIANKETKSTTEKTKGSKKAKPATKAKNVSAEKEVVKGSVLAKNAGAEKNVVEKESASKKTAGAKKEQKEKPFDVLEVEGYHHLKLHTYVYDNVKAPKAIVLIVHGMMEHAGRYDHFARFLNENGYIVVANDLRGHGHSAVDKKFGFGEKDIFFESVQDEIVILEKLKEAYAMPIYLFGHSYGSMLSQAIIQNTNIVEKCVLCGTANGSSAIMKSGSGLSKFLSLFKNERSGGGFIEKMCIKNYGKKFENGNWLTRDNAVFEAYNQDEFCGGSFPFSFYKSMLTNMSKLNAGVNKIGRKKIFIIGGACDPVGSKGKQITSLNKFYLKNNIDSRCKVYKDCRHELLNELNKDEVYNDILEFFNN